MGRVEEVSSLTRYPKPTCGLGVPRLGGAARTPRLSSHFYLCAPFLGTGPRSLPSRLLPSPAPGPAPPRAGAAGMFSPPRGAASCPPCWKPIPVTDSGPLRSGGGRVSRGLGAAELGGGSGSPPAVAYPPPPCGGAVAPGRGRPSPRRRPGCVTRWRPRGPGRVPGVRGGGGWGGGGKRPRGERPAAGPARQRPRFPLPGAAGGAGGPGGEPASKWGREEEAAGDCCGAPWGRRAGGGGDTFWVKAVPEGRVGYPAGTRLPGHEFLCHRNLVSCQVRSRLRLSGFHLGPLFKQLIFTKKACSSFLQSPSIYLLGLGVVISRRGIRKMIGWGRG